jgi:hypothetical protein
MRRLTLNQDFDESEEIFPLMPSSWSDGVVFPGLRKLHWPDNPHTLPFHRLLLSPTLTTLSLKYYSFGSSEEDLSILRPVIMGLDTSHLRDLYLRWFVREEANRQMESVASCAVLRCGPALKGLGVSSSLSDAAVQHIMQLPNLSTWCASTGLPRTPNLSLSDIFPRLNYLTLAGEVSLEWLAFFTTTAHHISSGRGSHSSFNRGPVQRLCHLHISTGVPINAVLMSHIMHFRELTFLNLLSNCDWEGCAFSLTDNDIAEITSALPRLVHAVLGMVCSANSCRTTVASLVSFSTQCRDLESLEVHFNTANLRNDLESVTADPRLDNLPSLRTSNDFHLSLTDAPLAIDDDDSVSVLSGFRRIFPSLVAIGGGEIPWGPWI